ncbi:hypothetical protein P7K49_000346 [Saguinus oedipus]|uniref:Uncharacterized protein n=1 Tax=Saguinus oedipus TaxID=9490 RepID=A0ABQ9WBV9_SAGOE|nr:hypothetical protein P7K49_000346 [Saguinus oedipus]
MTVPDGSVAAAGLGLPAADYRGHYQLLLSGRALADRYRRIYTAALNDRDQGVGLAGHPASRLNGARIEDEALVSIRFKGVREWDSEGNGIKIRKRTALARMGHLEDQEKPHSSFCIMNSGVKVKEVQNRNLGNN